MNLPETDPHSAGMSPRERRVYDCLVPRYGRSQVTAGMARDIISALYMGGYLTEPTR